MQSAKHVRKLKHIRQVKAALRYREKTKERLAPIKKENEDTKQYIMNGMQYRHHYTQDVKNARRNAREDWNLGPLRPNRAVGGDAELHGTFPRDQTIPPEIPKHWLGAERRVHRRMKTKIPESVARDQWPIVVNDRVIIIRGREKNKIGEVTELNKQTNTVIVKDVNKILVDDNMNRFLGGNVSDNRSTMERGIPYEDVRLIFPRSFQLNKDQNIWEDVIVEAIDMERHSNGMNPFTGTEEFDIPQDEQLDPRTEDPIYHRYIAGTRERIAWPWEDTRQKQHVQELNDSGKGLNSPENEDDASKEDTKGLSGYLRTKWGNLTGASRTGRRQASNGAVENDKTEPDYKYSDIDLPNAAKTPSARPREREPPVYQGTDTSRNIVESPEYHTFVPTLTMAPFPSSVVDELRDSSKYDSKKTSSGAIDPADHEEPAKERTSLRKEAELQGNWSDGMMASTMKTPLQVKWELEQMKKEAHDSTKSREIPKELLVALGQHMVLNGQRVKR